MLKNGKKSWNTKNELFWKKFVQKKMPKIGPKSGNTYCFFYSKIGKKFTVHDLVPKAQDVQFTISYQKLRNFSSRFCIKSSQISVQYLATKTSGCWEIAEIPPP